MPARTPLEARAAERAALERALAARLTGSEWRVLGALVVKVTKFDRCEDRVANSVLAELTGIAPRHVREALAGLAAKGVIEREPGGGRLASLLRFPSTGGTESGPPESVPGDAQEAPSVHASAPPSVHAQRATSEVSSEASTRKGEPRTESVPPPESAVFAARRLVQREPFEADDIVLAAETKYGTEAVAEAIAGYVATNVRVAFASELRKRLDRDLAGTASAAPAAWTSCGQCHNGIIETDSSSAVYCSCHPRAAVPA